MKLWWTVAGLLVLGDVFICWACLVSSARRERRMDDWKRNHREVGEDAEKVKRIVGYMKRIDDAHERVQEVKR